MLADPRRLLLPQQTLLAGLFLLALGAAPVRAECGDYVHIGGKKSTMPHVQAPASEQPTPLPCDGPACKNRGELPVVPPATATTLSYDSVAALLETVHDEQLPGIHGMPVVNIRISLLSRADVFHPPRG